MLLLPFFCSPGFAQTSQSLERPETFASVAFDRADPMWETARNTIRQSVQCLEQSSPQCNISAVAPILARLRNQPQVVQLDVINRWVNSMSYVSDRDNYQDDDYWARVDLFLQRGGDCEDYAIAKYALLRAVGFRADQLHIVVVDDLRKGMLHALLAVTLPTGDQWLDSQTTALMPAASTGRYHPRVAVNESGLWRHRDQTLGVAITAAQD